MITIVNSGAGNIKSVLNMLSRSGVEARITADADEVGAARKLVLPGVGAFDAGVSALRAAGLDEAIREAVLARGATLLGICLGMHLLLEGSEEGTLPGLALISGRVRRFSVESLGLRVPHMGWNVVRTVKSSPLLNDDVPERRFYFVHSFYADCADSGDVVGVTRYGHDFHSVIERGRIMGVQFHPEKSHRFGIALFQRFLDI